MTWTDDLGAGRTVVHARLRHPAGKPIPAELERRYRCIADRHEPRTYNPLLDATGCTCGRVVRPGNHGRLNTLFEDAEGRWWERAGRLATGGIRLRCTAPSLLGPGLNCCGRLAY